MIFVLVLFAFIFVVVLAFSSSKKRTVVRKIDTKTGAETVEIHETDDATPAQSAARGLMWVLFAVFAVALIVILGAVDPHPERLIGFGLFVWAIWYLVVRRPKNRQRPK